MIFGLSKAVIASVILVLSYAVLFSERLNRAVVVLLGSAAMILLGVLSYDGRDYGKIRRVSICGGGVGKVCEG